MHQDVLHSATSTSTLPYRVDEHLQPQVLVVLDHGPGHDAGPVLVDALQL